MCVYACVHMHNIYSFMPEVMCVDLDSSVTVLSCFPDFTIDVKGVCLDIIVTVGDVCVKFTDFTIDVRCVGMGIIVKVGDVCVKFIDFTIDVRCVGTDS